MGETSRHTAYDLRQMQSMPLDAKIVMTQERIRQWYDHWDGQVYVSFSGGKDSTVLKHIVDGMYDDVPAVFVNTGLEYPEIQQFVRDVKAGKYDCFNPDVEIISPEMRFDEVIKKYGYPVVSKEVSQVISESRRLIRNGRDGVQLRKIRGELRTPSGDLSPYNCTKYSFLLDAPFEISQKCCAVMKKRPSETYGKKTGRKPMLATMACESRLRESNWIRHGCNAFDSKQPKSQPMSFWTEQDILHYIKQYSVPYCPVYGEIRVKQSPDDTVNGQLNLIDRLCDYTQKDKLETTGCNRTGCMFCMFGCHLEKEPNRFQRMKITHPKQYAYCMKPVEEGGLGLDSVLSYLKIPH